MSYFIRKTALQAAVAVAVSTALLQGVAQAGVITHSQGVTPASGGTLPVPHQKQPAQPVVPAIGASVTPSQGATPKAVLDDNAQGSGAGDSSTRIWQKTITAPPSGRIQHRSLAAMKHALVSAYQAGTLQALPAIAGTGGQILYAYGHSLPTLVTAPLHTSIIELQPGSHPAMATGAPKSEWSLHAVQAGDQPELTVMPLFAGLHTDLVIPATSASGKPMNYVIEMTSDQRHYTPVLGFYYPGRTVLRWNQQAANATSAKRKAAAETVSALPNLSVRDMHFDWKVHCSGGGWFSNSDCRAIEPQRVFSDKGHVYIQFKADQASHGGIPSILAENSAGQNAIINAQFRDGYYIVDSLPDKILLIAGKGGNGKVVKITRAGHN